MVLFSSIKDKFSNFLANFGLEMVLDFGSSRTRILVVDKGIIVDEATMLARHKKRKWVGLSAPESKEAQVIAYGDRAKMMKNRENALIEVVAPVERGIVNDLEVAEELLAYYFSLVSQIPSRYPKILKFTVLVAVPSNVTDVEKRALRSVLYSVGARRVYMIESAILASVGLGLDMNKNSGLMVIDVGGGKTEISVVSLGGVVVSRNLALGGVDWDNDIVNFLRMKYGVLVGLGSAERIKKELAGEKKNNLVIRGRDLEGGLPKTINVSASEVIEALSLSNVKLAKIVAEVLDEMPPEIVDDVFSRGIWLVGGGAMVGKLAETIQNETKVLVKVADDSQELVVKGGGMAYEDKKLFKRIFSVVSI